MAAWNSVSSEMMQVDNNAGELASSSGNGPLDYKTMLAVLKAASKDCDAMLDKVSVMSAKFASHLTKLTAVIDPEVNAILYKKFKDMSDFSLSQQRALNQSPEEVDRKYMEMCDFLDQHVAETYGNQ